MRPCATARACVCPCAFMLSKIRGHACVPTSALSFHSNSAPLACPEGVNAAGNAPYLDPSRHRVEICRHAQGIHNSRWCRRATASRLEPAWPAVRNKAPLTKSCSPSGQHAVASVPPDVRATPLKHYARLDRASVRHASAPLSQSYRWDAARMRWPMCSWSTSCLRHHGPAYARKPAVSVCTSAVAGFQPVV